MFNNKKMNIAITGLSRSGKTVFLTSLADNFVNNQDWMKSLGYATANIADGQSFNHNQYIKKIKKCEWPKGTSKLAELKIELFDKNNKKIQTLNFMDYPGEWILDFKLLKLKFEAWSMDCYNLYGSLDEMSEFYTKLETVQSYSKSDMIQLSNLFKKGLKELKENAHFYNLTPGRFIMPDGEEDEEKMIFFPFKLDGSVKQLNKLQKNKIYKECESNYNFYKKNYIKINKFKNFDKQIVMLDLFEMLYNGEDAYDNIQQAIKHMFEQYEYQQQAAWAKVYSYFHKTINNTAIVATKLDLISSKYQDNYKMLLDELVEGTIKKKTTIPRSHRFVMSSLVTTTKKGDNILVANLENGEKNKEFIIPLPASVVDCKWGKGAIPLNTVTQPFHKEYSKLEPLRTDKMLDVLQYIIKDKIDER